MADDGQTNEDQRALMLSRLIPVPRAALYRCWTDPALITRWFTPAPWKTVEAELDVRAGGRSRIVMESPDGDRFPSEGLYLEVVENEKLVFTDAFTAAWQPSNKAFMVGIITFADEAGGTRYTATVRHWNAEDRKTHEEMGFHEGWGKATDQLAALAATLGG
ncbi:SRPBCC family protein [Rhizobium sp. SG2393]|uniref:SRPBCC family protein n=1 Tax=Rhizobium sp. SG2393 TaxID=3276279 RepID=UPI003670F01A